MSSPRPLRDVAAMFVILVATLAVFAPVYNFDFTSWDDYDTVARNPLLNPPTIRSLNAFWTRPHGDLYIPVTYTVWAGVAAMPSTTEPATPTSLPRLRPQAFHIVNVVFHAAAAVLLFGVFDLLVAQRVAALIGALLFALHPVQVESVAWVSGTKDVLFGMLSLLAIYEYLQFTQHPPGNRARVHYAVATLAFVLAMLAKPTAMVVPLVVIVLDHFMLGRPLKQVLRSTWPWLVLAVPVMIVTKLSQPAAHATAAAAPILFRPLIAADALAFYFYKLVWPVTLTFDYGRTPQHVIETRAIAWTWIVPALLAVIAWRFRRRAPALAAGLLVGVIVLLPVLGLVAFDFQLYSTVADHYLYLAMLGPALIVAWCVSRRPTTATIVIAACVIAILGVRSFAQTKHWHDSRALFAHGIRVNPASFASYNSLAALAVEERDFPRAVDLSQRALRIRPNHANSHATLAEALRNQGDVDGAITALQAALKYEPDYQPALGNLAVALASRGRFADALRYARRLVELAPDSIPARTNLALIYLDANQPDAARAELEAILRLDPTNEAVRAQLRKLQRP